MPGVIPRLLALLAALLVSAVPLVTASPAQAHSDLVSSTPADGSELAQPPASVALVFNEDIAEAGLQVVAKGPDGAVTLGAPTVTGATVTATWPQDATTPGEYQVAYRVVSADGHPIDGTVAFGLTGSTSSTNPGASSSANSSTTPPTAEPSAAPAAAADSFPLWIPAVVVIVGVGVGAGIAYWLRSRRTAGH